jgi:hypothetical protein
LLDAIQIDDALIGRCFKTQLREKLIDMGQRPLETYLDTDDGCRLWQPGTFLSAKALFGAYNAWGTESNILSGYLSKSSFDEQVQYLQRKRVISEKCRQRTEDSHPWGFTRLKAPKDQSDSHSEAPLAHGEQRGLGLRVVAGTDLSPRQKVLQRMRGTGDR